MTDLYIITGPAGAGKSTISRKIAESKSKSVLIEGDDIYHQVVGGYVQAWKQGNNMDIFWKICIDMIDIYLSNGYTVVFNYIVNPENIKALQDKFKEYKIKFIILITDEGTLLSRDKERPKDCQMGERCLTLLNNFKNKNFNKNNFLDTSNLSVNETLEEIEKDNKYFI